MKYLVFFLIVVSFFFILGFSSQDVPGDSLRLVHVFFRHGARTPELKDAYPNDPYKREVFLPMGWGQLTNHGKKQAHKLGKLLRQRYDSFLGDIYHPNIVHAQSTDFDRTKMSALLALAGVFPPAPSQQWDDDLHWLPIPIVYEKNDLDYVLRRPTAYCPRYAREQEKVLQSEDVGILVKKNKMVFEYLTENTGRPIRTPLDVFAMFQTLTAERWMNLTLPEWSKSVYPKEITEIATRQVYFENSNQILKRLNGGRSLKMAIDNMVAKSIDGLKPRDRKIFLYSGHENNVINVLAALNLFKPHIPNYSAAVIFELHYLEDEDDYAVKVVYVRDVNEEPEELQVKGCDVLCPLKEFVDLAEPYVPLNYTEECESEIDLG